VTDKQRATDLEIKVAFLESVLNNPQLKSQYIHADVVNNDVKLTGSVQTSDQKTAAEALARSVPNVHSVDSYGLTVTNAPMGTQTQPSAQTEDAKLSATVESNITRENAITQPQKIQVQSTNGVVYLTGTAGSKAEKALAGQLARNTAGTKDVVNNIEVTTKR
jgi:osmotically-inducible protein OsmY